MISVHQITELETSGGNAKYGTLEHPEYGLVGVKFNKQLYQVKHEHTILSKLSHPQIPRVLEFGELADYEGRIPGYLLIEHIDGETMWDLYGRLMERKEKVSLPYLVDIWKGFLQPIIYMHSQGVVEIVPQITDHMMIGSNGIVYKIDFDACSDFSGKKGEEASFERFVNEYVSRVAQEIIGSIQYFASDSDDKRKVLSRLSKFENSTVKLTDLESVLRN